MENNDTGHIHHYSGGDCAHAVYGADYVLGINQALSLAIPEEVHFLAQP